jgi:hypothetical protein
MGYIARAGTAVLAACAIGVGLSAVAFAGGPHGNNGNAQSPPGQSGQPHGNSQSAPGHAPAPAPSKPHHSSSSSGGGGSGGTRHSSHTNTSTRTSHHTSGPQSGPDQGSGTPGTLNSDCTAHKDPRDPGSCQEKGRGNSFDRDPFRGPNRGNDCDEGGGNNVNGSRTNPHNSVDSPVDNDRGGGNNRCGTSAGSTVNPPGGNGNPPGGNGNPPGGNGNPPSTSVGENLQPAVTPTTPGSQGVAGVSQTVPAAGTPGGQAGTTPAVARTPASNAPAASLTPIGTRASGHLPFTGFVVLTMVAIGLMLCAASLGIRAVLARDARRGGRPAR